MAVYVLALAVCVVVLYASFRMLVMRPAGGESAEAVRALLDGIAAGSTSVLEQLESVDAPPPDGGEDPLQVSARSGRRRMAGYEQQLERLEPEGADGTLRWARDLLSAAVESTSWACRLAESGVARDNAGVSSAVHELVRHGRRCAGEARRLLSP